MNRLTVAFFTTTDANFASVLKPYLDGANAMLAPFSMSVEVFPTNGSSDPPRILSYTGAVFDTAGDPGTIRQLAHVALPNGRGIPVIFCNRQTANATGPAGEFGSTILTSNSDANNGVGWLPYILINTQIKSVSNETLLHEMIHAAYGELKTGHDSDPSSAFYTYGTSDDRKGGGPTRKLPPQHVAALRKAYFSVFAP
jgi:hypothetical protein